MHEGLRAVTCKLCGAVSRGQDTHLCTSLTGLEKRLIEKGAGGRGGGEGGLGRKSRLVYI